MKNKCNVIFLGFDYDYEKLFIDELKEKDKDTTIRHIYFPKLLKFLYFRLPLIWRLFRPLLSCRLKFLLAKINNVRLVIIKDDEFYINLSNSLKYEKIILFRNIATDKIIHLTEGTRRFTFDKQDAKKYSMELYNQFTPAYEVLSKLPLEPQYDATFVGLDKGRKSVLDRLKIDNPHVSFNISIVTNPSGIQRLVYWLKLNKPNDYISFIEKQYSTTCVIDIVQSNQSGETMRFIEAFIAGKKVITNNHSISDHELYSENNVYIIGRDKRALDEFIFNKFSAPEKKLLLKYSSSVVIDSIIDRSIRSMDSGN